MAIEVSTVRFSGYGVAILVGLFLFLPWVVGLSGINGQVPWLTAELWDYPGLSRVIGQSLTVGFTATTVSTVLASLIIYAEERQPSRLWALTFTAPHLAFAVAFLWLFTPFGWIDRLLPGSWSWFEHQSLPTLTLLLISKETPFLVVLGRQQLRQLPFENWLLQARSLGASSWHSWWLVVLPAWLKSMRLLIIAVAVYSVGVVDIASVAGPMNPPLLGPLLVSWQQQFDATTVNLAAQGFWLLIALTMVMVAWVYVQEALVRKVCGRQLRRHRARQPRSIAQALLGVVGGLRWLLFIVSIASGLALFAMSFAEGWFYPALLPSEWSLQGGIAVVKDLAPQLLETLGVALLTATLVTLVLVWTREWQRAHSRELPDLVFIAALLIPQTALVLAWLHAGSVSYAISSETGAWWVTVYAHCWFSFAFAYLSYAPAERAETQDHLTVGRSLGFSYWRSWWYFKRPQLNGALMYAFLVSFLVSIAQYVPTLLLGQGYVSTLTTELVVLSSGAEWQAPAVAAMLLWLLALLAIIVLSNGIRRLHFSRDKKSS
ncbi:ABC transporter permease subunit [Pseudidiomarina homiensis]|uniref:ABC transporter permease subunit n=1 Tax=Pseudidiomarina homiensis TaxID=364198 RepID=UPI00215AE7A9|nr:ABC transporter permease subunit [Pseudidiomarina homiensis]